MGTPPCFDADLGITYFGPPEREGLSASVVLPGHVDDLRQGQRVRLLGRLLVTEHAADSFNGVAVPAWVGVRLDPPGK
jgi:hypothetical protein